MKTLKKIWGWVWPVLLAVSVTLAFKQWVAEPVQISGPSMNPNLYNGEKVWSFKTAPIHRGSVIIFNAKGVDPEVYSSKIYVKRVIGVPGDTVQSKNGTIYVNGKPINQSYISSEQRSKGTGNWTLKSLSKKYVWPKYRNATKVPKGYYFVLGDNRKVSEDSRYFGFVTDQNVLGVVKVLITDGASNESRQNINKFWKSYWDTASAN